MIGTNIAIPVLISGSAHEQMASVMIIMLMCWMQHEASRAFRLLRAAGNYSRS